MIRRGQKRYITFNKFAWFLNVMVPPVCEVEIFTLLLSFLLPHVYLAINLVEEAFS